MAEECYYCSPPRMVKPGEMLLVCKKHAYSPPDPVHHPAHYTRGKIEVLDFIEDQQLGYHLGQVIKYVCRAGYKDASTRKQDLEKARFYLTREIERS